MPVGSISSSPDGVGVAVVNYGVPVCESHDEVIANCKRIADFIKGAKMGYPGLDLIIFPEYSTQGFHPTKWCDFTIKAPIGESQEVQIFKQACVDNKVYGIFSLTGTEHPDSTKNPYNTMIMITDAGEINMCYHKICPWVPKEPWTAGHETMVAEGPKGLRIGGIICYDGDFPEIVRDCVFKGAELVIRIQGYMHPCTVQQSIISQVRAFESNVYFAVANMAGRDHVYSYFGHSNIVGFDGKVLAECDGTPDQVQYATLSLNAIRDARANWTANNAIYNIMHRGYTSETGGHASCPFDFYKTWVNAPDKARAVSEALTRDADAVEDASNVTQVMPVPPPSLKGKKLETSTAIPSAKAANGMSNGYANGHHANGVKH